MLKKRNIFLVGPMGAGKSTVGRQLSKHFNMDFFDSDQEIEQRTGASISWVFDVEGECAFRNREEKIIHELTEKQRIILATGGGSIKSCKTRNQLSAKGIVIYLETDIEQQLIRTKKDKKRPLLYSEIQTNHKILEDLANERNSLYEAIADISICTDKKNTRMIVYDIINIIESNKFKLF